MKYYCEFESVRTTYIKLMKSVNCVHDWDVWIFRNWDNDVKLQEKWITIDFCDVIKISYVYNCSIFAII